MINELAKEIHKGNVERGFYEDEKNIGEMLALIHSEVSEALEADRHGFYCKLNRFGLMNLMGQDVDSTFKNLYQDRIKGTFEEELADIMIRVMDLAAFKNIDLQRHVSAKMRYNSLREYKHGKKY